jgi:drug/metabolite transporter (DMT)-like permease
MPLLLVAALLLAAGDVSANATAGAFTPAQLLCVQSGLWTLCLAPWALRHPRQALGVNRRWLLIQALANTAFFYLNLVALTSLPVTWVTSILSGATPLVVLIMVFVLFGVRAPRAEVAWMLLVTVGVGLVLQDQTVPGPHEEGAGLGLAAAFGASLMLAATFVAIARLVDDSVHAINLWYAVLTLALSLPLALGSSWPPFSWWPALYGLLGLAGQIAIVYANNHIGPAAASLVAALVPGMAGLLAWALYRQPPDVRELAGILLVVGGCFLIARIESRREQPFAMPFRWER